MTESEHLNIQQVRRATKYWALFAKYYDLFLKAHNVDELKRLYQKLKSRLTRPDEQGAADFFYRVRRDVLLGYITLEEMNQFLEEQKMIKEGYSDQTGTKSAILKVPDFFPRAPVPTAQHGHLRVCGQEAPPYQRAS